jgi:hypothetical protein
LNLTLPCCGGWNLTFDPVPPSGDFPGGYQFVHGEFSAGTPPTPVPEPATLGLIGTGLAGIVGVIRRKRVDLPKKGVLKTTLPNPNPAS